MIKTRTSIQIFLCLLAIVLLPGEARASERRPSSELLLPHFEVRLDGSENVPPSLNTFWAVVNSADRQVPIRVSIKSNWGIEMLRTSLVLEPRQVKVFNLADWIVVGRDPADPPGSSPALSKEELAHVQAALCGQPSPESGLFYSSAVDEQSPLRAVGSVVVQAQNRSDDEVLWGDFFVVEPGEDFAQGEVLANLDPVLREGPEDDDDLCDLHAFRFLTGGGFDSGTEFMVWNDSDAEPSADPEFPGEKIRSIVTAYDEGGNHLATFDLWLLPKEMVKVADLALPKNFGWLKVDTLEVETMIMERYSAADRYSVGMEAFCLKREPLPTTSLTVIKHVINDHGGTLRANDFGLAIDGQPVRSGVAVLVEAGSHTVSELEHPDYVAGPWEGDCNSSGVVILAEGEHKVCHITNDDIPKDEVPPEATTLTLIKHVINDDGGTLDVADFPLYVNGTPVTSGVATDVTPGTYTASEQNQPGYAAGPWGGDCAANGVITLSPGDHKTCEITNDDVPPERTTLTLVKHVINDDGGTLGIADFPLYVNGTRVTSGIATEVAPGTYTVSETSHPDYTASLWGGDCAPDGSVTLTAGQHLICEITNDDDPVDLQGCTPGYWKNHLGSWPVTGFSPSQSAASVFAAASGYPGIGSANLLDALNFGGGPGADGAARILLRAAVAGLLNEAHPGVSYPGLLAVGSALASGDRDTMISTAEAIDRNNNLGCPLN